MTDFVSLTAALDGWFDKPLSKLPDHLQERVREDFFPMPWESLSSEQRQSVARQWDYNHDPTTEQDRQFWGDFFIKKGELEQQIEQWELAAAPTAAELAQKESRLKELRGELARMQIHMEHARGDYLPTTYQSRSASPNSQGRYIAYPKAIHRLAERLGATPEELAAWVFMGPKDGGLAAYLNANELDPPPRFYFDHFMGEDYLSPMMGCWFLEDDIDRFNPVDRYITGRALIERWGKQPDIKAEAFIQAKIEESRLIDLHPTFGGTRGTVSEDDTFPPLDAGLFPWADVQRIEMEDGLAIPPACGDSEGGITDTESSVVTPVMAAGATACAEFRAMTGLRSHEISIALVGDKTEGLAGNNMLEVRARGVTRRVSLGEFDLVDRRNGELNKQAAMLIGLAHGQILRRSDEAMSAAMRRLRATLKNQLGLTDDPFQRYQEGAGWRPRFQLSDRRGLADQRAQAAAERRTVSYDQFQEMGVQFEAVSDEGSEPAEDEAAQWLRRHDPKFSG